MSQRVPNSSYLEYDSNDFSTMYFPDWNTKLHSDFPLDGLICGVPTRTTPTLTPVTPTTLRNFEQSFLEFQQETESHQNEAGFVPPLVQPTTSIPNSTSGHVSVSTSITDHVGGGSLFLNLADAKSWQGGCTTVNDLPPLIPIGQALSPPIPPHVMSMDSSSSSTSSSSSSSSRRNIGGRRPNKEIGISPEEEERKKLRRERNKAAAARCRKRRVDHTNQLLNETEELEMEQKRLEEKKRKLENERLELLAVLEKHDCRLRDTDSPPDVKPFQNGTDPFMMNKDHISIQNEKLLFTSMGVFPTSACDTRNTSNSLGVMSRQRPNFLPISNSFLSKSIGIPITTPSTEFLDALMEGGTGLTPITSAIVSSCSTQLRSSNAVDLSSPDSTAKKLVSL